MMESIRKSFSERKDMNMLSNIGKRGFIKLSHQFQLYLSKWIKIKDLNFSNIQGEQVKEDSGIKNA